MKKLSLALLAASSLLVAPLALADSQTLATVNIQQLMRDSSAAKSAHDQLEGKFKSFQTELSHKQDELQKEDQALGKQQSVLSKSAFEEKVQTFRKKVSTAQREEQSKRALLESAQAHATADIQKVVTEIVADIAKEKGFTLAIAAEGVASPVLYADPKIDITSEVLDRLNKKLPALDVKFDTDTSSKTK